jgi:iron complex outermembrane recepter protein
MSTPPVLKGRVAMKNSTFTRVSMFALAAATLAVTPAYAQDAKPADAAADSGDIVVTATRNSTLLSKTPIAMTAVSGDGLRAAGVTNAANLQDISPNLSLTRNGGGLQITIRGVTSTDLTEKGDPSASFLLDGIYISRPQATEVSFFDVNRVEVLRGPQGTLFGRNTTAGAINVIPNQPSHKFEAAVNAGYGNYNNTQIDGMINVPLGDTLAVRGAVSYDRRDNYVLPGTSKFSLNPGKNNIAGRLAVKFDPTDALSITITGDYAKIKGNNQSVLLTNFYNLLTPQVPGSVGTTPVYNAAGVSASKLQTLGYDDVATNTADGKSWGVRGELKYQFSDRFAVTYLGSYRGLDRNEPGSASIGEFPFRTTPETYGSFTIPLSFTGNYHQNTHELRLSYSDDKFKAQVGGYYFHEDYFIFLQILGLNAQTPGQRGYVFGFPQGGNSKSTAFFGQATYSITDSLRLTGGARYTSDDKTRLGATINEGKVGDPRDYTTGVQPGGTNPDTRVYTYADGFSSATPSVVHGNLTGVAGHAPYADTLNLATIKSNKLTWRVGLDYDLAPHTLLYGTVSTGYKSGGFNDGCGPTVTATCATPITNAQLYYQPETITSYEAGIKASFAGGKVRLNADIFHYDYTNLQLSQVSTICGGPCQVTTNAGKAKVDGVEIDGTAQPDSFNKFDFSFSYLNARYTNYLINAALPQVLAVAGSPTVIATPATPALPAVSLAGLRLDRSPELVATAGYTHTVPLGDGKLDFNVHTKLSSAYYMLSATIVSQFRQPSFTKTGLSVTYTAPDSKWYLQGYANNLENTIVVNRTGVSIAFPGLNGGTAGFDDPRTFGVRAGFKF